MLGGVILIQHLLKLAEIKASAETEKAFCTRELLPLFFSLGTMVSRGPQSCLQEKEKEKKKTDFDP